MIIVLSLPFLFLLHYILFVATVARDSAAFVATLPVETGSVASNTALSVAKLPVECQSLTVNHFFYT